MSKQQRQKHVAANMTKVYNHLAWYGDKIWSVFPGTWNNSWGPRPNLGYVKADSKYWARYAAYDAGILPRGDVTPILEPTEMEPGTYQEVKSKYGKRLQSTK